jgi:ribosome recycling factor
VLDEIMKDAGVRMSKSVVALQTELTKIRTGRAHTSLLDHITVEYYGSQVPLNQAANIGVEDSRTLTVTPWEKDMVQAIEKAIMGSDLGLNPASAGTVIRVPLPALTEDRRKDMIRIVRHEAENGRIAVRNIRRDAMHDVKELLKEKMIGKDEEHRAEGDIQTITDKYIPCRQFPCLLSLPIPLMFQCTLPSSWTAMAVGRVRAARSGMPGIVPASNPCARLSKEPQNAVSAI